MMKALDIIKRFTDGDFSVLKKEKWLLFLGLNSEVNVNFERIVSFGEMKSNYVLSYVERELEILEKCNISEDLRSFVEETLKWSEVAKGGLTHKRLQWRKQGYNLVAHNIGSSQIYGEESKELEDDGRKIVNALILTHGLIGQYIRGEVQLVDNMPLWELIKEKLLTKDQLRTVLRVLNLCVISGVSNMLWEEVKSKVEEVIELIVEGNFNKEYSLQEKLKALRSVSIKNGENFQEEFNKYFSDGKNDNSFGDIFSKVDLWYVEAALYDFSFEEFIKIFNIINSSIDLKKVKHISFSDFMKEIYYEHAGKKRVNIYKKRIIEKYLSELSIKDIVNNNYVANLHVGHEVSIHDELDDTLLFTFKFSSASNKLIDFCVEA
ncbi:MAG: SAM-dependent methyltransferase, partial [Clostridiaceae bacterium]|nr:SAM-dependent methyltransferase [Clostridiaceae bacterium]